MRARGAGGTLLRLRSAAPYALQTLFLRHSPQPSVRVERRTDGGHVTYTQAPVPAVPPPGPWAIHLADASGRFRWIAFDLDASRGDVGQDLAVLLRLLEEAGLRYVVTTSGPSGGRHVWVTAERPLPARLVARIGQAASRQLPTLDHGMLCNPRTGAVRPVGAPHRDGGRSMLLHPSDEREAAALLAPDTCGNPPTAFAGLAALLGTGSEEPLEASSAPAPAGTVQVVREGGGPRLAGTPRMTLAQSTQRLLAERPTGDASAHLAAVLVRLAWARWSWPMVRELLTEPIYRRGGLLHACTVREGSRRREVDREAALTRLRRQWGRCVAFAARTPRRAQDDADRPGRGTEVARTVGLVTQVQAAADAAPARWARSSGPADRALLDLLCLLAVRSGRTVLDLDTRRAALATGFGRSTMHRAIQRLGWDGWVTPVASPGPAGTLELLRPHRDGGEEGAGGAGFLTVVEAVAAGASVTAAQGGTQGFPPPGGEPLSWPSGARYWWEQRLNARLAAGRADVLCHGRVGGLGHHTGRVYQVLVRDPARPVALGELVERSGYRKRSVLRMVGRMRDVMLVSRAVLVLHHECPACGAAPGGKCTDARGRPWRRRQHRERELLAAARARQPFFRARSGADVLVTAAQALGVHGVLAARARRYAAERELWDWWRAEQAWMRAPKRRKRTESVPHGEQRELVLRGARTYRRRYPRGADGRADHATARARIRRRLALV